MGLPAARLTDPHVCPAFTGPVPHVGGVITSPGMPQVLIAYLPAARISDMVQCAGPPGVISAGASNVLIGGLPAARQTDSCAHGGMIAMGCPTVLIGTQGGATTHLTPAQIAAILGQAAFPGQQNFGNCGIQSTAEIIYLQTGVRPSEDEILAYAIANGMASDSTNPTDRGSSTAEQRQALLAAYGVDSTVVPTSREALAEVIRDGNCAIVNADAGVLWNDPRYVGGGHAVTVTGGTFDADGNLSTVTVNDTGTGERHEMPADDFFAATEARRGGSQMNIPTPTTAGPG